MTCEQCIHKNVCPKEHLPSDIEPEHFYYSDKKKVEDVCDDFLFDLNVKEFPCHVGQKVYYMHEKIINNVRQPVIEKVFVITIRLKRTIANEIISKNNVEDRVQIFIGPTDSNVEYEVHDTDFGKTIFYSEDDAIMYLLKVKRGVV